MQLVNLSKHPHVRLSSNTPYKEVSTVNGRTKKVFDGDNMEEWVVETLPAWEGPLPSLQMSEEKAEVTLSNGMRVTYIEGQKLVNLPPEAKEGVMYIVPFAIAKEVRRTDVVCPEVIYASVEDNVPLGAIGYTGFACI